eukprot:447360-Alexandrium_andersonii.AAC.1
MFTAVPNSPEFSAAWFRVLRRFKNTQDWNEDSMAEYIQQHWLDASRAEELTSSFCRRGSLA